MVVLPIVALGLLDEEADFSFWRSATDIYRDATIVVRVSISFARSAVVGSDMAEGIDATVDGGERAEWVGGTADGDEEHLVTDTRLSRASGPRVAGPRLRSS
jgi:hypothetical protein